MTAPTLAMERTALAWRRTSLGAAGCSVLFAHEAAVDSRQSVVLPLAAATVSLLLAYVGWHRSRALGSGRAPGSGRAGIGPVATTTVAVALVALIAVVSVLYNG
ncbi:DUF202 domain-containing protein [Nocardia sp. NPDC058666]|uniref:DUF202 domain-containing protein n=1 Tax=Nocardia sp. NPDC058666 TaxID=3346587 RepID=UPI003653A950